MEVNTRKMRRIMRSAGRKAENLWDRLMKR